MAAGADASAEPKLWVVVLSFIIYGTLNLFLNFLDGVLDGLLLNNFLLFRRRRRRLRRLLLRLRRGPPVR